MDPVWLALGGMGLVGVGLVARSLSPRMAVRSEATPPTPVTASATVAAVERVSVPSAPVQRPSVPLIDESIVPEIDEEPSGPIAMMKLSAGARTDQGLHRTNNEDSLLFDDARNLFAVCDGMGGHAAGEVASRLAVDVIARAHETARFEGVRDASRPQRADQLARALLMANKAIYTKAREDGRYHGMGTTVVAARFSPSTQRVHIAHIGDSRCYRLREGKLRQITKDHTLGSLGVRGPTAGKLVRSVGTELKVQVDVTTDAPEAGDQYVLCSDGLSRMVPNSRIEEILVSTADAEAAANALVAAANEAGGRDNVTVIVVRIDSA